MSYDLNTTVFKLLSSEPFFAALSRHTDKIASESIPTAGIGWNKTTKNFQLLYNPKFMESLSGVEALGVLKHEFYHVVFEHVQGKRISEEQIKQNQKPWNVAMDLAINSHLDKELPEMCCMPGKGMFKDFPAGQCAEWYFAKFPKDPNGGKGKGDPSDGSGGEGQFDDHSGFGDMTEEERQICEARAKEIMQKAAGEAMGKGWGTVSSDTQKQIAIYLGNTIDWRKLLRYFIRTSKRADKHNTVRKLNKRYAYIHPGVKVRRQANVAISIDQSGSVNDGMLSMFFAELNSLSKIAEFTVIPFDCSVFEKEIFTWKKGQHKATERVLSGGTDFNAPTNYVNKKNFDGHIILTDMCAPAPKRSSCQRIWITTEEISKNPYFQTNELIIGIPPKSEK